MAKDKICKQFVGIISPENKFTVDTIEDMKGRKYLKIGDVVDLNGYYTAGDGAHHKRKIASADDGSGVQLSNGLWANIVHNGEVNVSWFGAKGDGVTDDGTFLQKALDFEENMKVVSVGVSKITSSLNVKRNTTFDFERIVCSGNSNIKCEFININITGIISGENSTLESGLELNAIRQLTSPTDNYVNVEVEWFSKGICINGVGGINFNKFYLTTKWVKYPFVNEITEGYFIGNYIDIVVRHSALTTIITTDNLAFKNNTVLINQQQDESFKSVVRFRQSPTDPNQMFIENNFDILLHDSQVVPDGKWLDIESCFANTFKVTTAGDRYKAIKNMTLPHNISFHRNNFVFQHYENEFPKTLVSGFAFAEIMNKANLLETDTFEQQMLKLKNVCNPLNIKYLKVKGAFNDPDILKVKKLIHNNGNYLYNDITLELSNYQSSIVHYYESFANTHAIKMRYSNSSSVWGSWLTQDFSTTLVQTLDTPYHATKMQQEGVYEDFIQYMDEKTEYDRLQRESENQPEGVMLLPAIEEPQPSEKLLAFKEKYLG